MNQGIFGFPKKQSVNLPQVVEFEESGSFTVPPNAKKVSIGLVGGGGGGGGGFIFVGSVATAVDAGQGGQGGNLVYQEFDGRPLHNRTLIVGIGAGGEGGAGQAWDSGLPRGNPGQRGNDSTIRVQGDPNFRMTALGGSGGIGGGTASIAAATNSTFVSWNGMWGTCIGPVRASATVGDVFWHGALNPSGAPGGGIASSAASIGKAVNLDLTPGAVSANDDPHAYDLPPVAITAGNIFGASTSSQTVMVLSKGGRAGSATVAGGDGEGYSLSKDWQPLLRTTLLGGVGGGGGGGGISGSTSGSGGPGWHGGGGGGAGAMHRNAGHNAGYAGTGGQGGNGYAMIIVE